MAKPHRMFAITVGCVGSAVEGALGRSPWILYLALTVIVIGAAATAVRRTVKIVRQLPTR